MKWSNRYQGLHKGHIFCYRFLEQLVFIEIADLIVRSISQPRDTSTHVSDNISYLSEERYGVRLMTGPLSHPLLELLTTFALLCPTLMIRRLISQGQCNCRIHHIVPNPFDILLFLGFCFDPFLF